MTGYDSEPIPGLPGQLPPGERILWQGSPVWRGLAKTAFHVRGITAYFALLTGAALIGGSTDGALMTAALGAVCVSLLLILAWASARTTIYTLTNRRIVLRIGIAVPKCINLPLTSIGSVDLAVRRDGTGDLPLALAGRPVLGYAALWPHARPWRLSRPLPMLRAVPDAADVAAVIARACLAANPNGRLSTLETPQAAAPLFAEAQAA